MEKMIKKYVIKFDFVDKEPNDYSDKDVYVAGNRYTNKSIYASKYTKEEAERHIEILKKLHNNRTNYRPKEVKE